MRDPASGPRGVERVSGEPPTDPEWRADALAQSRHSRLDDVLVEPLSSHDRSRAAAVCAEITRRALVDFAPALVLLDPAARRRVQGVAAFSLTLFDFARQSGLEGEKLAQLNRWSFDLEATLEGSPPGQPVFVALDAAASDAPWPPEALDDIVACARHRALERRAPGLPELERRTSDLARALASALLDEPTVAVGPVAALLRLHGLLALGDDRRRGQAALPIDELPDARGLGRGDEAARIGAAVRAECRRIAAVLDRPGRLDGLPARWRRALTYGVLAGRRLLRRVDRLGAGVIDSPPRLGALERSILLIRARWTRLRETTQ